MKTVAVSEELHYRMGNQSFVLAAGLYPGVLNESQGKPIMFEPGSSISY